MSRKVVHSRAHLPASLHTLEVSTRTLLDELGTFVHGAIDELPEAHGQRDARRLAIDEAAAECAFSLDSLIWQVLNLRGDFTDMPDADPAVRETVRAVTELPWRAGG